MLSSAKLDATGQRWIAALQGPYNFKIHYKPGKLNQVADSLSRIDRKEEIKTITEVEVKAILHSGGAADVSIPFTGISGGEAPIIVKNLQFSGVAHKTWGDWQEDQRKDNVIRPILAWKQGRRGPITKKDVYPIRQMYKQRNNLVIQHGLLYRMLRHNRTGKETFQFLLPTRFRKRDLEACHDEFCHQGMDKTTLLLQKRFFWNGLVNDTREHIRNYSRCLTFKTPEETSALERIECSYPLEMLHLDFLTIGQTRKDSRGDKKKPINVLVATDHLTRFAQAYVTTNQRAKTVADIIWEKFISQYGWPEKILNDQGGSFEAELFEKLCEESKID